MAKPRSTASRRATESERAGCLAKNGEGVVQTWGNLRPYMGLSSVRSLTQMRIYRYLDRLRLCLLRRIQPCSKVRRPHPHAAPDLTWEARLWGIRCLRSRLA